MRPDAPTIPDFRDVRGQTTAKYRTPRILVYATVWPFRRFGSGGTVRPGEARRAILGGFLAQIAGSLRAG
jgi:hypothetical protein